MKNSYQCHECDNEFELPKQEEPSCPECGSREVTFEGHVPLGLWERTRQLLAPVVTFLFMPWRFYSEREMSRTTFILLILISTGALLVAGHQLELLPRLTRQVVQFENAGGTLSFFRNYQNFIPQLTGKTTIPNRLPAWLVVYLALVVWEFIAFCGLYLGQFFAGGKATGGELAYLCGGTIWVPNLLLGAVMFLLARGFEFGLWRPEILSGRLITAAYYPLGLWILYCFLSGLKSITELSWPQYLLAVPAIFGLQFICGLVFLFGLNVYLFPGLGLGPVAGGWLKPVIHLVGWPYYFLLV